MKFQTLNNWQQRMIIPKKAETEKSTIIIAYCLERVSRLQHGTQPHPSSLSSRGDTIHLLMETWVASMSSSSLFP